MPEPLTVQPRTVNRRRIHMAITVHPETVDRLDTLCAQFASTRGRVIDKVIDVLARSYSTGTLHCVHGQPCQIGRKDLPAVM